ncbi:DUF4957 domain-containing protein [Rufibacter sediminis]|uniref:DUF4957 domain-containing protein n=1 Tax=Rufibacter sediminis TaxID=2762756 RepID=A0ABR6VWZ7_9BACT|nr:DUF4957 domain-containing protein [Rufibacter sediminis]MBC3541176.1 DUF4957 domain-containing protein [Rufibacter sediminis]
MKLIARIHSFKTLLLLACLAVSNVACKEDDEVMDADLKRAFTPVNVKTTNGETQAVLQWNPSLFSNGEGVTYTVEVAKSQDFQNVEHSVVVDTAYAVLTDKQLDIKQDYYARIRANAYENAAASNWMVSPLFRITGEQIFATVMPTELTDRSVILRWRETPGLTRIVLTSAGGTATEMALTAENLTERQIKLTGLTAQTAYTAEIFAGATSKGVSSFTTKEPSLFDVILEPSADVVAAVTAATNGQVIGLAPGTYDASAANILITGKQLTIRSTTGNPKDVKVLFKEITLKGTGAGVRIMGIEFDGRNAAGEANAGYFINIDAAEATLTSITIESVIVHDFKSAFMRGNRGAVGAQKIDFIKVDNSIVSKNGVDNYQTFMLDKLDLNKLEVTNSTFNEAGRGFISYATAFMPTNRPTFFVDKVTLNNFGSGGRENILFDASSINVNFTMQNSIIANSPKPGQLVAGGAAIRAGSSSTMNFNYNNYFKLEGGSPLAPLTFPDYVTRSNNKTIDLGWTATTTDFTLPVGSELRTAGVGGAALGDPRWAQ